MLRVDTRQPSETSSGSERPGVGYETPSSQVPPQLWKGRSATHLWWLVANPEPVKEIAVTITVKECPTAPLIYFWAMQASFSNGTEHCGGAHLGLQWHPYYPDHKAVNWGGYCSHNGAILAGTDSILPKSAGDVNTRDFNWIVDRPYRLRISLLDQPGPSAKEIGWPKDEPIFIWRGEITDLVTNQTTTVRDLYSAGNLISGPVVWSEIFARCDDTPAAVEWSDFECVMRSGRLAPITTLSVTHSVGPDGGCENSDVEFDGKAATLRTSTTRRTPNGAQLKLD